MKSTMSALVLGLLAGCQLAYAYNVEFFYTPTLDTCQIDGVSMPADEQSAHGGVCAYVPSTKRIYACPAPDPTCWTWNQNCKRGDSAGADQILCSAAGWCCAGDETCTTTQDQINVCISNFTSPNSGVDIAKANRTELQALGVSNVTATSQSADPTPFTTSAVGASSTSSSSTSSSTSSRTSTQTDAAASATGRGSLNVTAEHNTGISGGAIAGIVIGVVAGLALIGVALFFVFRRRRGTAAKSQDGLPTHSTNGAGVSAYQASSGKEGAPFLYGSEPNNNEKTYFGADASEMGGYGGAQRAELLAEGNGRVAEVPANEAAHVRHEMAG